MAAKTIQSLKINASWTPNAQTAGKMLGASLDKTDAKGVRIDGGRLSIKHSIVADYTDPAHSVRITERIAAIKLALASTGELHSFNVTAGSVPVGEAEVVAKPEPEAEAPTE